MRKVHVAVWLVIALFLTSVTVSRVVAADQADEAKIKKNLAKLSPKDQKLAQAQRWCAIETDNRLGEMGVPIKLTIKGETVFTCCKGCIKEAKANPDKTLQTVKELKAKAKQEKQK
ncbi:MAG TPA: hypothetical protein VFA18_03905 [Gemmataceae bacterium]|nr:hypothetical protein [Gemmataceae bacterium]